MCNVTKEWVKRDQEEENGHRELSAGQRLFINGEVIIHVLLRKGDVYKQQLRVKKMFLKVENKESVMTELKRKGVWSLRCV